MEEPASDAASESLRVTSRARHAVVLDLLEALVLDDLGRVRRDQGLQTLRVVEGILEDLRVPDPDVLEGRGLLVNHALVHLRQHIEPVQYVTAARLQIARSARTRRQNARERELPDSTSRCNLQSKGIPNSAFVFQGEWLVIAPCRCLRKTPPRKLVRTTLALCICRRYHRDWYFLFADTGMAM